MMSAVDVWSGFFPSSAQDWVDIFRPLLKSRLINSSLSLALGLEVAQKADDALQLH